MRRSCAALLGLLLAACASPAGVEPPRCSADQADADPVIAVADVPDPQPVAIECWEPIGRRRILLGFTLPGGPGCHGLTRVELDESADRVAVTLLVGRDTPVIGACGPEPHQVVTEVDLQMSIGDRIILDGSR